LAFCLDGKKKRKREGGGFKGVEERGY